MLCCDNLCRLAPRLQKLVKDLNRILQAQGSGPWAANRVATLERSAGELNRILEPKVSGPRVSSPASDCSPLSPHRAFVLCVTRTRSRCVTADQVTLCHMGRLFVLAVAPSIFVCFFFRSGRTRSRCATADQVTPCHTCSLFVLAAAVLSSCASLQVTADQVTLCHVGGLAALLRVLLVIDVTADKLPAKPVIPDK